MKSTFRMLRLLASCAVFFAATANAAVFEVWSGDNQMARVGTQYTQPWVLRVDPFEQVQFVAPPDDGTAATVTHAGSTFATIAADQFGMLSITVVANSVAGAGSASVIGAGGRYDFSFVNLSPNLTGLLDPYLDPSVPIGYETAVPPAGSVLDGNGNPAAGVAFTFTTDPSCASFDGAATASGVTGSDGRAVAPKLTGVAASQACGWSLDFNGTEPTHFQKPVIVYPISGVDIMANPASVQAISGHFFEVRFSFAWSGLPVQIPPGVAITVGADRNGATATLKGGELIFLIGSTSFLAGFTPNNANGNYTITTSVPGAVPAIVSVSQRKE